MKTITIQKIDKQDHEAIILLYLESYLAEGEKRNKEQITPFVNYLLKRPFKLKAVVDGKIIGGFISDIKPRHEGNILFDPEIFIHPDYQNQGFGRHLLHQALLQAQQTYQITDLIAFTFKESYQLKRYQKLGIKTDDSWQMLYGALDPVLKKLSETSQCKIKATNYLLE
ncbi:GNAT family N-acetyltransferase [Candidatus Gracilibacteria bacterium]|nr:GNAT family N-acetyltransferase [Candidatus Gracilibacteria bacterium]